MKNKEELIISQSTTLTDQDDAKTKTLAAISKQISNQKQKAA